MDEQLESRAAESAGDPQGAGGEGRRQHRRRHRGRRSRRSKYTDYYKGGDIDRRHRRKAFVQPSVEKLRVQIAGVLLFLVGIGVIIVGAVLPEPQKLGRLRVILMIAFGLILTLAGLLIWSSQSRKP